MKKLVLFCSALLTLAFAGCATQEPQGLTDGDLSKAAGELIQDFLQSPRLAGKPGGGQYVVTCGKVSSEAMPQYLDKDLVMVKVQQDLTNSGRVAMTFPSDIDDDRMLQLVAARVDLKRDPLFNPAVGGRVASPDLCITGKLTSRQARLDSSTKETAYYFQLRVMDLQTGLALWIKEAKIIKRGDGITW